MGVERQSRGGKSELGGREPPESDPRAAELPGVCTWKRESRLFCSDATV